MMRTFVVIFKPNQSFINRDDLNILRNGEFTPQSDQNLIKEITKTQNFNS